MVDLRAAAHIERVHLLETISQLRPEQWDEPSLCDRWRVRDVIGHLLSIDRSYRRLHAPGVVGAVRAGFRVNRYLEADARRHAQGPDLAAEFERIVQPPWHPLPVILLSETIIHGQDIRRPLGVAHTFDPEHLGAIASFLSRRPLVTRMFLRSSIRGRTLIATDADWRHGTGPEVHAPLETIVMALAGRRGAMDELQA